MTDATVVTLISAASPLVISFAALIKAYAISIEVRANGRKLAELHDEARSSKARVDNLEIGNLADAAANGIKDIKQ